MNIIFTGIIIFVITFLLLSWFAKISSKKIAKGVRNSLIILSLLIAIILVVGGFLIGFGTRYAGGCTSGHAISGLSDLQLPSLIAVIGFFIGGLLVTYLVLPFLYTL